VQVKKEAGKHTAAGEQAPLEEETPHTLSHTGLNGSLIFCINSVNEAS
jgi:hypothetical protein